TLSQAFAELARADKSGARVTTVPVAAARFELETLLPVPGGAVSSAAPRPVAHDVPGTAVRRKPGESSSPVPASSTSEGWVWTPEVDEEMLDLFFEEASDRIDALGSKLLEIERRPQDGELLRDLFRDLHTLKGSSAMVGLLPMKQVAHAAEDLVGQLRDQV